MTFKFVIRVLKRFPWCVGVCRDSFENFEFFEHTWLSYMAFVIRVEDFHADEHHCLCKQNELQDLLLNEKELFSFMTCLSSKPPILLDKYDNGRGSTGSSSFGGQRGKSVGRAGTRWVPPLPGTDGPLGVQRSSVAPTAGGEGPVGIGGIGLLEAKHGTPAFFRMLRLQIAASQWTCFDWRVWNESACDSLEVGGDVKLNATLGRQNFSPSFKQRTWQISRNELLRDRKCWRMSPSPPSSPRRRPRQPKWVPSFF